MLRRLSAGLFWWLLLTGLRWGHDGSASHPRYMTLIGLVALLLLTLCLIAGGAFPGLCAVRAAVTPVP